MRDTDSKLKPWRIINTVFAIALVVVSLAVYGHKAPLKGWLAWAVVALLLSLLAEGLHSREIGFSQNMLPLEASRDRHPLWYWFVVSLYVLVTVVIAKLA